MRYNPSMENFDGRKIDRKALEAIRIRAVKRVEAGESPKVVINDFGDIIISGT